ncbi:MAG: sialate O-acetylesterase [Granulosicoccus sp.]
MKIRCLITLLSGFYLSSCGNSDSTSATNTALSTESEHPGIFEEYPISSDNGIGNPAHDTDAPRDDSEQDNTTDIDTHDGQNPGSENTDTQTLPDYNFTLSVDKNQRVLNEGDSTGTSFSISTDVSENQVVDIAVRPLSASDVKSLSVELPDKQLDADNADTTVTFSLPVGMRPRLAHERRFEVVARSGEHVHTLELILDIKPIEVPDIYLLIGQSNMVGRTGDNTREATAGGRDDTNPRIRQLNVSRNDPSLFQSLADFSEPENAAIVPRYITAQDPLHQPLKSGRDIKSGSTIGPGLSFAKAAIDSTTQDIYLVPAAWESSGFCRSEGLDKNFAWNVSQTDNMLLGGSGLLERALTRLRMTIQDTDGIFRGILWQQGETDSTAKACADSYAKNLKLMVERIRTDAREDRRGESARGPQAPIPFIVSTQSKGEDERGDFSRWSDDKLKVDSIHRNIASVVPFSDWVNNDDLLPPSYPCGSTGCVHFGALASREIGGRFFTAIERIWQNADH